MKLLHYFLVFIIIAIAAAFRLSQLELRPMHGDEANQAVKTGILYDTGRYRYDPHEHHGPTLYYFTLPILWLARVQTFAASSAWQYRIVPALFGIGLVLMTVLLRRGLGSTAVLCAMLLTAISPVMVYYSRYYIQEMLLVFFAFGLLASGWRYCLKPSTAGALALGIFLGLLHATKETSLIIAAAMAFAVAATVAVAHFLCPDRSGGHAPVWRFFKENWGHFAIVAASAAAVSLLFFSSFLTHPRGPLDSLLTYATYFHRAEGQGSSGIHDKPWYYYLSLLAYTWRSAGPRWTEGLNLILAAVGIIATITSSIKSKRLFSPSIQFQQFLCIYALTLSIIFSLIPYKTPWNLLVFYHPLILLAGVGGSTLLHWPRTSLVRAGVAVLLLAAAAHLGWLSALANFRYPADTRNPYVYAHTSTALMRLVQRVDDVAALSPEGKAINIAIVRQNNDYWPLPWYLRSFTQVGYWKALPPQDDLPLIIADPSLQPALDARFDDRYHYETAALRPSEFLILCIRKDLWDTLIRSRS